MTAIEILTVLGGLGLGYLVVSMLMGGGDQTAAKFPGDPGWVPAEPAAGVASTWPEVLGLTPQASVDEIRSAHARLSAPYAARDMADLGPEFQQLAQRKLQALDDALREALRGREAT